MKKILALVMIASILGAFVAGCNKAADENKDAGAATGTGTGTGTATGTSTGSSSTGQ